jgi:hypothetical protein
MKREIGKGNITVGVDLFKVYSMSILYAAISQWNSLTLFMYANKNVKTKYEGQGLGLYIYTYIYIYVYIYMYQYLYNMFHVTALQK